VFEVVYFVESAESCSFVEKATSDQPGDSGASKQGIAFAIPNWPRPPA
jgi:hypothetical protein